MLSLRSSPPPAVASLLASPHLPSPPPSCVNIPPLDNLHAQNLDIIVQFLRARQSLANIEVVCNRVHYLDEHSLGVGCTYWIEYPTGIADVRSSLRGDVGIVEGICSIELWGGREGRCIAICCLGGGKFFIFLRGTASGGEERRDQWKIISYSSGRRVAVTSL